MARKPKPVTQEANITQEQAEKAVASYLEKKQETPKEWTKEGGRRSKTTRKS
jgi:hypothetical protein